MTVALLWRYLLLSLLLCFQLTSWAGELTLRTAQATVTARGATTNAAVALPYLWDTVHPDVGGQARFEIPFELPRDWFTEPDELYGLFIPRIGTAYQIWLNGQILEENGDMRSANGANFALSPRHIPFVASLLKPSNLLVIQIRADRERRGGLSPIIIGRAHDLEANYVLPSEQRVIAIKMVALFSGLICLLSLSLWFTQAEATPTGARRRDPLYLLSGLAELFWLIRLGSSFLESPPLPWFAWQLFSIVALGGWNSFNLLFCMQVIGWQQGRYSKPLQHWLVVQMLLIVVVAAAGFLEAGYQTTLTIWYGALGLTNLLVCSTFVVGSCKKGRPTEVRLLAFAIVVNVFVGVRDWYVVRITPSMLEKTYLYYASVLFGLTAGYIVIDRFRKMSAKAQDLTASLETRIAQREKELMQAYQLMDKSNREQERATERARILRDMHDGVGANLNIAIRQLETGRADSTQILQTLRDSLDQLKLAIDSMHLDSGDLTGLLANMRYRLTQRFNAMHMALEWAVDDVPHLEHFDHRDMRNLQFLVFEAISNALQHSHASVLRIELHLTDDERIVLKIMDNGCGFELDRIKPRGLDSLRQRAAAIGAVLTVVSTPGRTTVEVVVADRSGDQTQL